MRILITGFKKYIKISNDITSYRIVVKSADGIVFAIARYKSKEKLKQGEEPILFYKDESHLVKGTAVNKDYTKR